MKLAKPFILAIIFVVVMVITPNTIYCFKLDQQDDSKVKSKSLPLHDHNRSQNFQKNSHTSLIQQKDDDVGDGQGDPTASTEMSAEKSEQTSDSDKSEDSQNQFSQSNEIGKELMEDQKDNTQVFHGTYDMLHDTPEQIHIDLASIHLTEMEGSWIKSPTTKRCDPDEYIQTHWRAYLSDTGKLVEDTRVKFGNDSAPEIKIGQFLVTRCLDLALPQMKPGQKFKIDCPAKFAYGGASPFGMGTDHIPENSDLTYEVEVLACTKYPAEKMKMKAEKKAKKLKKKKVKKQEVTNLKMKTTEDEKKEVEKAKKLIQVEKVKIKKEIESIPVIQKEITKEKNVIEKEKEIVEKAGNPSDQKPQIDKQVEENTVKQGELEQKKEKLQEAKKKIQETEKVIEQVSESIKEEEKVVETAKKEEPEVQTKEEKKQTVKVEENQDKEVVQEQQTVSQEESPEEEKEEAQSEESKEVEGERPAETEDKSELEQNATEPTPTKVEEQKPEEKVEPKPEPTPVVKKEEPKKNMEKIKKVEKEKKALEATPGVTKESLEKEKKKIEKKVQKVVEKVEKKVTENIQKLEESVKEMEQKVEQAEPLKNKKPFFLTAADKDGNPTNFVLEVAKEDKYAPKKTGVFNVALKMKSEEPGYKPQQWFFDAETNGLHSVLYPSKTLFEGMNKNLIVYRQLKLKNQRFNYDEVNKSWTNVVSKNGLKIVGVDAKNDANVITGKFEGKPGQLWTYSYAE